MKTINNIMQLINKYSIIKSGSFLIINNNFIIYMHLLQSDVSSVHLRYRFRASFELTKFSVKIRGTFAHFGSNADALISTGG